MKKKLLDILIHDYDDVSNQFFNQIIQNSNEGLATVVKNNKTDKFYFVLKLAIDCTNCREGEIVVIYGDSIGQTFVRELREFYNKFRFVND